MGVMFTLLGRFARWIVRSLFFLVAFLIPYLARLAWFSIRLVFYSIISVITGVPRAVELTAGDWTQRANTFGIPEEHNSLINLGAGVVSIGAIIAGLCILASVLTACASVVLDAIF